MRETQDLFKGPHFDQEIIVLCIRWHLTFKLSSRDLVQIMAERGIALAHTTILRWVQRYARLMTQLEMMTSTELSGSGMCSISPFKNSTFAAAFALIFFCER
jgi:transposase-like protein